MQHGWIFFLPGYQGMVDLCMIALESIWVGNGDVMHHECTLSAWVQQAEFTSFFKTTWPGTQWALLLFCKVVKSGEMDSAIFLSTEISVLRAVARVSSGTLNKEAPAFCTSHPHNLLIRLKTWNVCDQCHSGMELLPANF